MKRFLRDIFIFIGCLTVLNFALYSLAGSLYFSSYKQYSLDYSKYLFSDSRGQALKNFTNQYGIYNFSAGSESYIDIKRKLLFLIQHTEVDTVYLSVDDHTLSQYRERANNSDRSLFYATMGEYENPLKYFMDKIKSKIIFFQPQTRSVIRYYYFSKMNNILQPSGSTTLWKDLPVRTKTAHSEERLHSQFKTDKHSDVLRNSLLDIIKICQSNNITLIGLKFPLTREYIQVLGDLSYGASELLEEKGCEVLDFKTLFLENEAYFENQDHLNPQGGKAFVKIAFERP